MVEDNQNCKNKKEVLRSLTLVRSKKLFPEAIMDKMFEENSDFHFSRALQ